MLSPEKLHALSIGPEWSEPLTTTFATFGINDVKRQAAFIGQCSHECNHFKTLAEKIANRIYASRMGNRGEESGDGYRFRGRGCIQLTGHDSYWHFGQAVGQDFVMRPELVATPMYAALSAGWFWRTHGCNDLAEAENWVGLTKRINGGTFGLDERIKLTQHALAVLGA